MNRMLNLEIPAEVLTAAHMSLDEVRVELAITLFRRERLSVGRAAELAKMPLGDFLTVLAARKIGPHMDADEAMRDAAMLAEMRLAS
jgi:predicted HTH domain antitoxin